MTQSILQAIRLQVLKTPDRLCFADAQQAYTYQQAWNAIVNYAGILKQQGVKEGECVIVSCTQDARLYLAEQAIQLARGIFVPLDRNNSRNSLREIVCETDARYQIGDHSLGELLTLLPMDSLSPSLLDIKNQFTLPKADTCAEILYSTGTTGKPKGIELTHRNDVAVAENVAEGVQMKDANVELIPVALHHSHGLRTVYANHLRGNSVVIANGITFLMQLFTLMDRYHVTSIDLVPSALRMLLKTASHKLANYAVVEYYKHVFTHLLPSNTLVTDWLPMYSNDHFLHF